MTHPLDNVVWMDPADLYSNSYNPNQVFTAEFDLLKTSILEDGWTQPVVVRQDDEGRYEIVDGFHRWTLATKDPEIREASGGRIPTVQLRTDTPKAQQILATVRHNRARGFHGVRAMAAIVQQLLGEGLSEADICRRMGMEQEEVERLSVVEGTPQLQGEETYGLGWVPGDLGPGEGSTPKSRV